MNKSRAYLSYTSTERSIPPAREYVSRQRAQLQFSPTLNHYNSPTTQVNATVKARGPISGSHSPREKEEYRYTGFSINSHYNCSCNCNHYRKNLNNWTVFYAVGLSSLSKVKKFLFFFGGGNGALFLVCFLPPFQRREFQTTHDIIAHRPIIQVFKVLWLSRWLNLAGDRGVIHRLCNCPQL